VPPRIFRVDIDRPARQNEPVLEDISIQRPRNLDWKRAGALLYGDWGTSKAYVLGLAFAAMGFSSLPVIFAVCALTLLVGINYIVICRCFPNGGGVYSAAGKHGKVLAVVAALLLVADLTVTAALSGWAALSYLGVPQDKVMVYTIGVILLIGALNWFGPRHSGSVAVALAAPTAAVVVLIIVFSIPHLTFENTEPLHGSAGQIWVSFVAVILALSGIEAIANLTGIMKLDKGATAAQPRVGKSAAKSIIPAAIEVSIGTALLGWAMVSLPKALGPEMEDRKEDMLRFLAEQYGTLAFGPAFGHFFGIAAGIIFALLLLSAVNTAIATLLGLLFMMSKEGDMPREFSVLNKFGVPYLPLAIATILPAVILLFTDNFEALAGLYAIGVIGAICLNLGSNALNSKLEMKWFERGLMAFTAAILVAVEFTLAQTKHDALFFVVCVLIAGLCLWAYSRRLTGITTLTVSREVAQIVKPEVVENLRKPAPETQKILVSVRGLTPVLSFALDEAEIRKAALYILYVREIAVLYPGSTTQAAASWKDDPEASAILNTAIQIGKARGVPVIPLFATATEAAPLIVDTAATIGADFLILGASGRGSLAKVLRGNVATQVAASLPDNIQLIIHG
jgi:amino acid transporter/nucleotide-binding universal stress UspA family protein